MGLWIRATVNTNLTVSGIQSVGVNIQMYAGWNLVSYPVQDDNNYTVADLKTDTGAEKVEGFNSSVAYQLSVLPDSYILKKGEAYWIFLPADIIWIIDW